MDLKFEGVDLEYKKAKNNLPESFWETYSAFANTNGGKIILGIDEKKKLTPTKESIDFLRNKIMKQVNN
ncbi:AlbA family DNA-binding domain-containing protein [Streptococcus pneumoniae]|uniref:AlbA family DNA-binding domain-containing protein n=1 Tax=Streptococcus pneumoniae TaxID=1313 RepID=UPI000B6DF9FA|nr:ATP-binding protein [Streptococcus pneumoniae]SNC93065.1 mobile genetic element [Streptococcus pneumoniae]